MTNCVRFGLLAIVLGAAPWLPSAAQAQSGHGLISSEQLAPYGLERMWFTQAEMNRGTSRLAGLSQFVSAVNNYTVFEFEFDGRMHVVSEFEKNAFNVAIGVEGAKAKAAERLAQLQLFWTDSGRKGPPPAPRIEQKVVPNVTLVATSDRGAVHCIDGETGKTRWAVGVGTPASPTTPAAVTDKFVAVVNGTTVYLLQAETGQLEWSRDLAGPTIGGPVASEEFVFVPRINGALETINIAKPKLRLQAYKSYGRVLTQPAISFGSIAWATDAGHLVVGLAKEQVIRFRVEAKDAITSKPAFHPSGKIYATSLDGYIYCVNEVTGQLIWRFSTGEAISQSPLPVGDNLYVATNDGNLYAISAAQGEEKFIVSGVKALVSASDQRIYGIDLTGALVIIDAASGARVGAIPIQGLDFPVLNMLSDRILLGKSTGSLQCIRESRLRWPQAHEFLDTSKKPVRPAAAPPGNAPRPNQVDPFAPAGADPFAPAPGAAPAPAADNDPFGAAPAAPAPKPAAAADPFAP